MQTFCTDHVSIAAGAQAISADQTDAKRQTTSPQKIGPEDKSLLYAPSVRSNIDSAIFAGEPPWVTPPPFGATMSQINAARAREASERVDTPG